MHFHCKQSIYIYTLLRAQYFHDKARVAKKEEGKENGDISYGRMVSVLGLCFLPLKKSGY